MIFNPFQSNYFSATSIVVFTTKPKTERDFYWFSVNNNELQNIITVLRFQKPQNLMVLNYFHQIQCCIQQPDNNSHHFLISDSGISRRRSDC